MTFPTAKATANPPPKFHQVKGACEPQDSEFFQRFSRLGGKASGWSRPDHLLAIRVLSSLEDDLELEPRPENHKRAQASAMRRVRRLLEAHVGDTLGTSIDVRKTFPLSEKWKAMP